MSPQKPKVSVLLAWTSVSGCSVPSPPSSLPRMLLASFLVCAVCTGAPSGPSLGFGLSTSPELLPADLLQDVATRMFPCLPKAGSFCQTPGSSMLCPLCPRTLCSPAPEPVVVGDPQHHPPCACPKPTLTTSWYSLLQGWTLSLRPRHRKNVCAHPCRWFSSEPVSPLQ